MMKQAIKYLYKRFRSHLKVSVGFLSLVILLTACEILDKEPLDSIYQDEVWNTIEFVDLYLNDIYLDLLPEFPYADGDILSQEGLSEETQYNSSSDKNLQDLAEKLIYGKLQRDDVDYLNRDFYAKIAKINRLLRDIKTGNIPVENQREFMAQALFFRAYGYWEQVNLQGGIPMMMEYIDPVIQGELQTEKLFLPRNKTSECIDLIINDLDTAIKYLPAAWENAGMDYGRITRGAALALKGRILLFWASPQFNPQNKIERWQRAYDANKTALEILEEDGYGLHPSFTELFHACEEGTREAIFVRVYSAEYSTQYHSYDAKVRPSLAGVSGGGLTNNPTWEMVQSFPMVDGFPIHDNTGSFAYDTSLFWQNRDPRFEYTIAYNTGVWPLSGIEDYKIWTYYTLNKEGNHEVDGKTNHKSKTGFFCKKYINPTFLSENLSIIGTDWIEIRFAEVLLNFTESANELEGKTGEVREALNRIRNERTDVKAGMDYIDKHLSDRDIIREAILNERQVELAFENKRYFDLRRRNMFSEDLGPNVKKLNSTTRNEYRVIFNEAGTSAEEMVLVRSELDFDNVRQYNNSFVNRYPYNLDTYSPIAYPQPEYNFYPIQRENIEKNPNFEQTIYWEGSFDPLEE